MIVNSTACCQLCRYLAYRVITARSFRCLRKGEAIRVVCIFRSGFLLLPHSSASVQGAEWGAWGEDMEQERRHNRLGLHCWHSGPFFGEWRILRPRGHRVIGVIVALVEILTGYLPTEEIALSDAAPRVHVLIWVRWYSRRCIVFVIAQFFDFIFQFCDNLVRRLVTSEFVLRKLVHNVQFCHGSGMLVHYYCTLIDGVRVCAIISLKLCRSAALRRDFYERWNRRNWCKERILSAQFSLNSM